MTTSAAARFLRICPAFHTDLELRVRYRNGALKCRLAQLGQPDLMNRSLLSLVCLEERDTVQRALQELLQGQREKYSAELCLKGTTAFLGVKLLALRAYDDNDQLTGIAGMLIDLGEPRQAQDWRSLAATIIEHTSEAVMVTDSRQRIIQVNPAFTQITGYRAEQVIGRTPRLLRSGLHDRRFYQDLWRALREQGVWHGEICDRHREGHQIFTLQTITAIKGDHGQITHYVSLFSDISGRKAAEQRLAHLATHDALTQLPNRMQLFERLRQALRRAEQDSRPLAVLFLDLDGFKPVNDALGHETGDRVLQVVAQRLRHRVRRRDAVARLGGDEFVVLLEGTDAGQAGRIAAKLIQVVHAPIQLEQRQVQVGVSIGISLYPQQGTSIHELLRYADNAMYRAKAQGGLRYCFYDALSDGDSSVDSHAS